MTKIAIIGAGKMGTAMAKALSQKFEIILVEKDEDINEKIKEAVVLVFAVKPQDFDLCADSIKIDVSHKLIVSIMAGVSLDRIRELTGATQVIRSMPNLPLQIQEGFTGWIATPEVEDKTLPSAIFSSFGDHIEVKDEDKISEITALTGCGPGYFYFLTQLLAEKAEDYGFTKEEANRIANQTLIGSANLIKENERTAKEMKESVASKGGSTEAALNYLQSNDWDTIFKAAVDEAKNRFKK